MSRSIIIVALLFTACSDSTVDVEWQEVDKLSYAMPTGWTVRDQSERDRQIKVWTPHENVAKESVTLMTTRPLKAVTRAGLPRMATLLEQAQQLMPGGRFGEIRRIVTSKGMAGVQVEGTFVPTGGTATYRRIHVLLLDGDSLVHVLYTAGAGQGEDALNIVLDSMQRRGA